MKKAIYLLLFSCFITINLLGQDIQKKVLIIGVDGCRPDALAVANTPNMDAWISQGLYSPHALNDDITISGPGWSAILCGVRSDKHLVTNNDFSGNNYADYPSIFKFIEDTQPSLHTLSICHWAPINTFIVGEDADFKLNASTDAEVASLAANYLEVNDPDLVFLHFDDVDSAGHGTGFSPEIPEYIAAIEGVDTYIGIVWSVITQRPSYANEDWLVIVTTDHGGQGRSHGGNSKEEREIFFIASNTVLTSQVINKDTMLIIDAIENCLGDAEELVFDGDDDRVNITATNLFDFGTDRDFTVECRVRTDITGDFAIVGNKNWNSGFNPGFVFSFKYPAGPEWKVNIGDGSNRADIDTGGAIADNEWHTLSVSFDRDGWMKMYQDGSLLDSADISAVGDITSGSSLTFGTDPIGAFDYQGSIAEVRVWNSILSAQDINAWHCTPLDDTHPSYSELIGYWKLNDGTGTTILPDLSSFSNDGLINDASWENIDTLFIDDYSNTPRLVDVVPSALTHLCIPIDENWQLEGNTLIPECMITSTEDIGNQTYGLAIDVFPNPVKDQLVVVASELDNTMPSLITVYDAFGKRIHSETTNTGKLELAFQSYQAGIYFVVLTNGNRQVSSRVVKL